MLIEKLKSMMQIFRLKIGPPFPLQSMEMEDQFSNEKSALQISTFQLASMAPRIGKITYYHVQPRHLVGIRVIAATVPTLVIIDRHD